LCVFLNVSCVLNVFIRLFGLEIILALNCLLNSDIDVLSLVGPYNPILNMN